MTLAAQATTDAPQTTKLNPKSLKSLAWLKEVTLPASDTGIYRSAMKHVYSDNEWFVATDGHRLHRVHRAQFGAEPQTGFVSQKKREFSIVQDPDLQFPNWQSVLVKEENLLEAVEFADPAKAKELLEQYCRILAALDRTVLEFTVSKERKLIRIVISANTVGGSEVIIADTLEIKVGDKSCRDFVVGLNPRYVLDAIELAPRIYFSDDGIKPVVFRCKNDVHEAIVMPGRIA